MALGDTWLVVHKDYGLMYAYEAANNMVSYYRLLGFKEAGGFNLDFVFKKHKDEEL